MVKILDFFPPHASAAMGAMDQQNLDIDFGNQFLMTDLPLRYVLQYALNHLRGKSANTSQTPGSVLLVARSRDELQTIMVLEQQRSKSTGAQACRLWRHLFPEDIHQTSTIIENQDNPNPIDVFEPELWSRIHMRYAPTTDHVQSLFQGLHLNPEDTNGVTSFGAPSDTLAMPGERNGASRIHTRQLPSLVMLVGCFSSDRPSLDDQNPSLIPDGGEIYSQNLNTLASSKAMSAIKDSIDWITDTSGQNVELAIFENTIPPNLPRLGNGNALLAPSQQGLWLERTIGFWVKTIINVARRRPLSTATELVSAGKEPHEDDSDSFQARIKTRESLQNLLDASSSSSVNPGSTLPAMTTIEWDFDYESCTFRSAVSSQ